MFKVVILILYITQLTACASQTFHINGNRGLIPTDQKTQNFFIVGIGQEEITNASEVCGGVERIIKVESKTTLVNGFFSFITLGLYTPRDANVYCKL